MSIVGGLAQMGVGKRILTLALLGLLLVLPPSSVSWQGGGRNQGPGRSQGPGRPEQSREVRLLIKSEPGSCTVFLNGQMHGKTDGRGHLELQKPRGQYTIRVSREGYRAQERTILLVADRVERFVLRPILVTVTVQTDPPGARIFLDGKLRGKTSPAGHLVIPDVRAGSHKLRAEKEGYLAKEKEVRVSENDKSFSLRLSPDPIWVMIDEGVKDVERAVSGGRWREALEKCEALAAVVVRDSREGAKEAVGRACGRITTLIHEQSQLLLRQVGLFGLQVNPEQAQDVSQLYGRVWRLCELLEMETCPNGARIATLMHYWRAKGHEGEGLACQELGDEEVEEAAIHYDLGWCAFRDRRRAEWHFFRARDLRRDWALPYFALAKVRWDEADQERDRKKRREKFEEIIGDLTRALTLNGEYAYYFHADRALAYVKIERKDDALADARRAVQLQPSSAYARYALGFVYYQAGKRYYPNAERELGEALRLEMDKLSPEQRKLVADWLREMRREN